MHMRNRMKAKVDSKDVGSGCPWLCAVYCPGVQL